MKSNINESVNQVKDNLKNQQQGREYQSLFKLLQQCDSSFVYEESGFLYSHYYNLETKTLDVAALHFQQTELDLDGLNLVWHITGDLIISSSQIKQLNSLNYLQSINNLYIRASDNLEAINGFNSLIQLNSLEISNNANLQVIYGFSALFRTLPVISGSIKIVKNKKLESLLFLSGLQQVKSSFYLHLNNLNDLAGLESLNRVGASFSVSSNQLSNVEALGELKQVGGMLGLAFNRLSSLKGLESLRTLKTVKWNGQNRTLILQGNQTLQDISGISNIISSDYYLIMHIDNVKQYTEKPDSGSYFHKNILEIYDAKKNVIPAYLFSKKRRHDYNYFRNITHSNSLSHLVDFEVKSEVLILSFSGFNGYLGGVFHNRYAYVTDNINVNKIFINDVDNNWYHKGLEGLTDIEKLLKWIKQFVDAGEYKKIICIGASMGGYMALLVGHILKATDIIALSPQTFIDTANREKYSDTRWSKAIELIDSNNIEKYYLDLALLYKQKLENTHIQLHYSQQLTLDERHAKHIGLDKSALIAYDTDDHYLAAYLHKKGQLSTIIGNVLGNNLPSRHKILFGNKWQIALKNHAWLDAYHVDFKKIDQVVECCKKKGIQYIFANNYTTQLQVLKNQQVLQELGVKFIVNKELTLKRFVDKEIFYQQMVACHMQHYLAKHYQLGDLVEFPCMVKPKTGGAGRGVFIAYNKGQLIDLKENMIISEYLPGKYEFATSIFYKDGVIRKAITFIKETSKDVYVLQQLAKHEVSVKRVDTPFLDIFKMIVEQINGVDGYCACSVNYKIINNQPKIFEINPRIGFTLAGSSIDFKEMIDIYVGELENKC